MFLISGSMDLLPCLLSVSYYWSMSIPNNMYECVQHAEYCVSHPQSPCHSRQAVQHLATGQRCKHQSDEHHCDTEKHSPPDRETGTVHLRETSRQTDSLKDSLCQVIVPPLLQRKQRFRTQVFPMNIFMAFKDKKRRCRVRWVEAEMHLNTLKHKKGPINKG